MVHSRVSTIGLLLQQIALLRVWYPIVHSPSTSR